MIEIFSRQSKEVNFFYDTQLFPVTYFFLQKLVQNVARTFKKTAWQVILLYYIPDHRYRCFIFLFDEFQVMYRALIFMVAKNYSKRLIIVGHRINCVCYRIVSVFNLYIFEIISPFLIHSFSFSIQLSIHWMITSCCACVGINVIKK